MMLENLSAKLERVSAMLQDLAARTEPLFLSVGDCLARTDGAMAELIQTFSGLPRELDKAEFHRASDSLGETAEDAFAIGGALHTETQDFHHLLEATRKVGPLIARLQSTIKTISILAVNAQIVAPGVGENHLEFAAFISEISRLTARVGQTIADYLDEYGALKTLLADTYDLQRAFEKANGEPLLAAAQELRASLTVIAARRRAAAGGAVKIETKADEIRRLTGTVVMGLQIGDITRQRAEHVVHALAQLGQGLPGAHSDRAEEALWSAGLAADEIEAVVAGVCRLQSAQTGQMREDLRGEIDRIDQSLAALTGDAELISRFAEEIYGTEQNSKGSFLDDLEEKLDRVKRLLQRSMLARVEVDRVVEKAESSVARLIDRTSSIRVIEVDMRLVGLNMALKCGRLGQEGQALRAIALELRAYAQQIIGDSNGLLSVLQDVGAAVAILAEGRRNQGVERLSGLEQKMNESLCVMQDVGNCLSQSLDMLSGEAANVATMLARATDSMRGHDRTFDLLRDIQSELQPLAHLGDPAAHADLVRQRLDSLTQNQYTMASERTLHLEFSPGAEHPAAVPLKGPAAVADLDDFLF